MVVQHKAHFTEAGSFGGWLQFHLLTCGLRTINTELLPVPKTDSTLIPQAFACAVSPTKHTVTPILCFIFLPISYNLKLISKLFQNSELPTLAFTHSVSRCPVQVAAATNTNKLTLLSTYYVY